MLIVGSVQDLRTGSRWFDTPTRPIFFPRIDDGHCDRIHSFLTAVHCFDNGYAGKQPVALEEYFAEYWLQEFQEGTDRCTGRLDSTDILLKTALTTKQSMNHIHFVTPRTQCRLRPYFMPHPFCHYKDSVK